MIRRTLAAASTAALVIALAPAAPANASDDSKNELKSETASVAQALDKGPVLDLASGPGARTYIVQLEDPAIPTRHLKVERSGSSVQKSESAYARDLRAQQASLKTSISRITGGAPEVLHSYTHAVNGIAVKLTRTQAQKVARIDGVKAVQVSRTQKLTTDNGPEWIGAPSIWDGSSVPDGVGTKGEGVIVGILDTGLNPANPSFADVVPTSAGGDGYDHTNPWGADTYVGVCDPANPKYVAGWGCNDKLIGYWNFEGTDTYDDDGHGSHTGSTAAGNQVEATAYSAQGTAHEFSVTSVIKGVAPHANIVGYDVCDGAGCQSSAIIAAIDQAIVDEIDVINYSIGSSSPSNPWDDPDAVGFLNARAAGIHVATSAGNAGPGAATVGSPGDVPWMTTVGATTHDRKYVASVTNLTADGAATHPDIAGAGLAGATSGAFAVVDAGAAPYNNALCELEKFTNDPALLTGKIVVCTRGTTGRVQKGEVVASLGAEGMILVNDAASGDSLNGDAHALPAAHITYDDGVALKQWIAANTNPQAALSGSVKDVNDANGDIMAAFSSRGPNRSVSSISPSVSAPGVDILAAAGTDNATEWHFISGTSMASPHTAGALALLAGAQPGWTPAQAQSALMTTSERNITDSDGTVADWFDMGSGRIELRRAAKAGLVLDETLAGYEGANPATGGDVRALNTASMADDECLQSCQWTRTFEGTSTGVGTWTVSVENLSEGITLSTDKTSIAVTDGGTADVTVTAEVAPSAATDTWLFGTLVLTPPAGSEAPVAHLPVGVLPSAGVLPSKVDITTRRDAGSQVSQDLEAIDITDLQVAASGLVPEKRTPISVVEDSTNGDPYDGNGVVVTRIDVPEGAASLIASLADPTAPDFDMYVGRGEVSAANEVAMSASGGSAERVEIAEPEAGSWWVLVQNWEATTAGGTDTADLLTAVVAGDPGNLWAEGPDGAIEGGTPFDIRTFFDEPAMEAGQTWHGALTLSTAPGRDGDIGVVPVTVHRVGDDVTKTADVEQAAPGETITYTVDIASNVTPETLTYTVNDTLPEGTTYVPGSATNGATFADGKIAWTGDLASGVGVEGNYEVTTSLQDPACQSPFGPGYVDLAGLGISPQSGVVGDTTTFSAFSGGEYGFYGKPYKGLTFSDDGFLVFGDANYGGSPWKPQTLPDTALPNSLAALLWQDMELRYDAATGAGVTIASTGSAPGDVAIIEYDDMRYFDDEAAAAGQLDMQVFATAGSSDLVFAYDNITAGPLLQGVTIGAENATASKAATLVNAGDATSAIANGMSVCLTYVPAEPPTASFSYQVTVDGDVHDRQELVNSAVHTTSDPGAKPGTSSVMVVVKDAKERSETSLSLNPDRFGVNGNTEATATVFSAGEPVATGDVQFMVGDRVAGTATVDAEGMAKATLGGFTAAGVFPVTAKYLGNADNHPSTSPPVNVVVTAPGAPLPKVGSRIDIDGKKVIKKGKRAKLSITVTSSKVTPTGTVTVTLRGAGLKKKHRTITASLNAYGKVKIKTAKLRKVGKVRVKVVYSGDAAVLESTKRFKFKVVERHRRR